MPQVLTADDSAAIQRVVQVSLTPYAIDVISADNFSAACEKIATQQIDLVIADAELTGIESLPDLQRLTAEGKIPLILLLSSYSKIDESTLTELGFQQILHKPFESKELLQLVAFNLQLDIEARSTDWQPFPATPPADETTASLPQRAAASAVNKDDSIDHNFATLVRKAVFEYCQNHFPSIARELVLEEIRRLQNEKSNSVVSS